MDTHAIVFLFGCLFSGSTVGLWGLSAGFDDAKNQGYQSLCEYSKYATPHYKLIDDVIYCKSSDNSYQMLQKHKPKSDHNKEHQR